MSEQILDGTGSGRKVGVDATSRLLTRTISITEQDESLQNGKDWNIETGYLTLTTANNSALMYLKNTGLKDLKISLFVFLIKASTGGTGDIIINILRNPTGGTVVTDALDCNSVNMNFGSSEEINADNFYGGEGKTLTGNDNSIVSKTTADNRVLLGIKVELPKGSSLGLTLTPPAGNTSMDVNAILEAYEQQT